MILIEGVTKAYPSPRRKDGEMVVVDNVSLRIKDGEFLTIVGPSGCGKTTLLHVIAGFEMPTIGKILVDGKAVDKPGADRAVVFQEATLFPWLSVTENISLGPRFHGWKAETYARTIQEYLEVMGLKEFSRHRPSQLSGGMKQRVAIARALIMKPRILLMDEPFGALDAQTRSEMQRFLLKLWQDLRITVIFVTHDVDEAILLGDRVVIMTARPGRIVREIDVPFVRPRRWNIMLTQQFLDSKRVVLDALNPEIESGDFS